MTMTISKYQNYLTTAALIAEITLILVLAVW